MVWLSRRQGQALAGACAGRANPDDERGKPERRAERTSVCLIQHRIGEIQRALVVEYEVVRTVELLAVEAHGQRDHRAVTLAPRDLPIAALAERNVSAALEKGHVALKAGASASVLFGAKIRVGVDIDYSGALSA